MESMSTRGGVRRLGVLLGVAAGAVIVAALADTPLANADAYDLQPDGPGTVVSDTGYPDVFAYGTVSQEIAEFDDTTGQVATGAQAGSLDVTEHIFTSPLGSIAFIDGLGATDGTGTYAADAGNASAYDLVLTGPFGGVTEFGNIPLDQIDYSDLTSAVGAAPTDDFGLSGLGLESLVPGLESLLNVF